MSLRAWCLASVLLAACQAPASSGAVCTRNGDCEAPLACTYGHCRAQCASSRDCSVGLRCVATTSGLGVCSLPSEERCTPEVCAAPLACVADQCRTSCGGDDDCREGTCSSGTCVEPVGGADAGGGVDGGGVDAGVLVDTGPQTDAGVTCDTSGWPADQALLDGLFSDTLTGPAGLRAIRSTTLGPFPTPTEGGVAVAGQIAVAARLDTGVGHAWVLWLEGTTRATHLMTLPLDRPELAMDADLGGGAIVDVRSFDLHTDRNAFVGVITSRSDAGVVGVHLVDEDATQLVTSASMFQSAHPSDTVLGRAIVTGGLSAFAGSTAVPVRYVVGDGSVARSIGRDGTLEDTVFPSAVGFLDGAGAAGEIYVFGDTTYGAGIWNLHGGPTSTRMITTSISGPPTVATLASDPTVAFVAWPDGHAVSLTHYDCTANCTSVASASTPPEATLFARRAALATLGSGVALVTLYTDASDQSPTLRVEHVSASGVITAMHAARVGPSPTATEHVVDLRIAAAPGSTDATGPRGAGLVIAALLRDTAAMQDRVWLGGVYGCAM